MMNPKKIITYALVFGTFATFAMAGCTGNSSKPTPVPTEATATPVATIDEIVETPVETPVGPEYKDAEDYLRHHLNEFADYLISEGWAMAGSNGCTYCRKQKADFSESKNWRRSLINEENGLYLNCGSALGSTQCGNLGITSYPTWVQLDENGELIRSLSSGYKALDGLAELTGFSLPEQYQK